MRALEGRLKCCATIVSNRDNMGAGTIRISQANDIRLRGQSRRANIRNSHCKIVLSAY